MSVSLKDKLREVLGDQLDQLPEEVLAKLARVQADQTLVNPHLPEPPMGVDTFNDEVLSMYPPSTQGEAQLGCRKTYVELQELIIPKNRTCDLHEDTKNPDDKLEERVERKVKRLIRRALRAGDENLKYVFIITGGGLRGEIKSFVEGILIKLHSDGLVLQYFLDRHREAFRVEVK